MNINEVYEEVIIAYPDFDEHLLARVIEPGLVELTQFSHFMPLIPGDTLTVDDATNKVTGVLNQRQVFVVEAYFRMDSQVVTATALEWERATVVEQSSPLTVYVVSESMQWITDEVTGHPEVDMVHPIRVPSEVWSFEERSKDA